MDYEALLKYEFPFSPDYAFLNYAAVAPWPTRTAQAVTTFAQENVTFGPIHYPQWLEKEAECREQLRQLINAPSTDDIALLKNTSEGLSVIAHGLAWRRGDNIVISDQEFPSNRIVWQSLAAQGVDVRQVDLLAAETPELALIQACDANTRLLSVSSVQYATGLRIDLAVLGDFCQSQEILFCVDAIQSLGALPLDVRAIQADFVVADGHKWLLGPEGLALFYCRQDLRDHLSLHQYGWHMIEQAHDYDQKNWQVAQSARRFECGSPNMLGIHALSASLSLILELGITYIEAEIMRNREYLYNNINKISGFSCVTLNSRYSGIIAFGHQQITAEALYQQLRQQNVISAVRGGHVRFSAHVGTSRDVLDRALAVLAALA